jgi:hypothetical protein
VYCIIDGIQWLDDQSTEKMLDGFLELLQAQCELSEDTGITLKVLLTTAGQARCLLRSSLGRDEMLVLHHGV